MIEHEKDKYNWEFLFLGANIDEAAEAQRFGIRSGRAVRFENDCMGQKLNYDTISKVVSCARSAPCASEMSATFDSEALLEPIRPDYEKRGN